MKIDLVFPALPPALDGIGDHTALLAQGLHQTGCDVRIHTAQAEVVPIPGVPISTSFTIQPPYGIRSLADAVAANPPDWLFVQFNQFSYGRYGFNPWLPLTLRQIKQACPNTRIAWMAHEDFVPVINWKFAIMTLWQRWQFWKLGQLSDHIFFSIDPWVQQYGPQFDAPATHLPVGSNMPRLDLTRSEARDRLGFSEESFIPGIFGTLAGKARLLTSITTALRALHNEVSSLKVLYVGPDGDLLRDALPDLPVHDAGRLPEEKVSLHLSAMDLHLSPFVDGLSTRRGSAMAGLQHGIATVSTDGELTDPMLREANGNAFVLTPTSDQDAFVREVRALSSDPDRRKRIGEAGRHFFDAHFSWDALAARVVTALESFSPIAQSGESSASVPSSSKTFSLASFSASRRSQ